MLDISYDSRADVLYISFGKPSPGIAVESNDGDLVRLDPYADKIIGITIIDFKARYMPEGNDFEKCAKFIIPKIIKEFEASRH